MRFIEIGRLVEIGNGFFICIVSPAISEIVDS
ncbi:MAG: hypothetical protein DDT22_01135 [candidate division WS2 bacterium]|nr:hypothetical protein [Candidatus Lithacetigena glycinireducens]